MNDLPDCPICGHNRVVQRHCSGVWFSCAKDHARVGDGGFLYFTMPRSHARAMMLELEVQKLKRQLAAAAG